MDAALWVAKTGLSAQSTRMTVIANNLANVNTVGFKRIARSSKTCYTKELFKLGRKRTSKTRRQPGLCLVLEQELCLQKRFTVKGI